MRTSGAEKYTGGMKFHTSTDCVHVYVRIVYV